MKVFLQKKKGNYITIYFSTVDDYCKRKRRKNGELNEQVRDGVNYDRGTCFYRFPC